jgi:archaellum component FlaC
MTLEEQQQQDALRQAQINDRVLTIDQEIEKLQDERKMLRNEREACSKRIAAIGSQIRVKSHEDALAEMRASMEEQKKRLDELVAKAEQAAEQATEKVAS